MILVEPYEWQPPWRGVAEPRASPRMWLAALVVAIALALLVRWGPW